MKNPTHEEVIKNIKEYCTFNNITHRELAEKVGWTTSRTGHFLRGLYTPRLDTFLKVLKALDIDIEITFPLYNPRKR
jgi:transcriptional regulator with XRE-family HTH domain